MLKMTDAVVELLNSKGVRFTPSGQDYLVCCFNPEHPDRNPSMRIDKISGIFNCLACGYKGNLFKYYGVFSNPIPIKTAKLKQKLQEIKRMTTGLEMLPGAVPYTKVFRGVSVDTLKHFGAFYTNAEEDMQDRIVFPITDIRGKTVVYVGRHIMSNGNPRYLNFPRGVQIPIFPAYAPKGFDKLILVEGLFDLLNLYDKGIKNVSACFGTNTLQKDTGQKLFPFKAQGISKIFIMFDGDTAGQDAAKKLKPLIEAEGFEVEIINLPEGSDPGDLGIEDVLSIKEYVK